MELSFGQRISGLTADGVELHAAVFDENQVRAAAGVTMVIGRGGVQPTPISTTSTCRCRSSRRCSSSSSSSGSPLGLRSARSASIARAMTLRQAPDWVSAKPKRFAWTLGLGMSFAMMIITNSGIRGMLPRTICAICLTLMWMESVLGLCLGCKVHALLVRRGWATKDPAFEICAHGECELASMAALLETPALRRGTSRRRPRSSTANPCLPRTAPRRAPRHRVPAPRRTGEVYLDYTGGSLYARVAARGAPADAARRRLRQPALGQPDVVGLDRARGAGARGRAALLQCARERVRVHLHAERHRRAPARRRGVPVRAGGPVPGDVDNHNSVNGIREFARAKGARDGVRAARGARPARGRRRARAAPRRRRRPAQAVRLSGAVQLLGRQAPARMDRRWRTSAAGTCSLDCAAFVPTSRLDLSRCKPDFVAISFYKMFGYPTGVGALLARRRRSRGCGDPGSAAAPWSPRTCRATWSCRCPATRGSRTAP